MRQVTRHWDPFREIDQLQREMNRLFANRLPANGFRRAEYPPVNLWHNAEGLVLTAELAGLDPEKLDVTVTSNTVTLRGTPEVQELGEGESWYRRERPVKPFARTVELPFEVNPQRAEATYEKGVLTLRLPRPEEQKPRKVTVKVG